MLEAPPSPPAVVVVIGAAAVVVIGAAVVVVGGSSNEINSMTRDSLGFSLSSARLMTLLKKESIHSLACIVIKLCMKICYDTMFDNRPYVWL
jgi:hypothetical protein